MNFTTKKHLIESVGNQAMTIEVKTNINTDAKEAYFNGKLIGYFEQMTPFDDAWSFMSKCSHDELTGDHYIAIGNELNKLNKV
jgi:hypothetical protein